MRVSSRTVSASYQIVFFVYQSYHVIAKIVYRETIGIIISFKSNGEKYAIFESFIRFVKDESREDITFKGEHKAGDYNVQELLVCPQRMKNYHCPS